MWYKNIAGRFFGLVTKHTCDTHRDGQTAGWMKTPLGTKVDLHAVHIVLDGFPALRERGTAPLPLLGPCLLWPRSPISAGTSQLITRSTRHTVKSCDKLTDVFHGVVMS